MCCVKRDNNVAVTQCFKAQSISLGPKRNVAETKALTTRLHLQSLSPTSKTVLKFQKKKELEKNGKKTLTVRNWPDTVQRLWCC